jgi:DNA-binding transcriptional MerR regulator
MKTDEQRERWLTAAECAVRTGLTVRALRVYEAHGLIAPKRTGKNWRLYGTQDIERLHEILALKRLGLSLARITQLLAGRASDLNHTLALQKAALIEARERTERGLSLIAAAQTKMATGKRVSISELIDLVKETTMTNLNADAVAWRRYEQARPRTETHIDPVLLGDYAGHYLLDIGAVMTIARDGAGLKAQLTDQPAIEIFAESDNQFFYKVVQAQISFVRAADGRVNRMVLHQNGVDMNGERIEAAEAQAINAFAAKRVKETIPYPNGEKVLRGLIKRQQDRDPAYEQMTQGLAAVVREQQPIVDELLDGLGAITAMTLKAVEPGGWDVYSVQFERGALEWRLAIARDDKVSGLAFRKTA